MAVFGTMTNNESSNTRFIMVVVVALVLATFGGCRPCRPGHVIIFSFGFLVKIWLCVGLWMGWCTANFKTEEQLFFR